MRSAKIQDSLCFQHGSDWSNRITLAPLTNNQSNLDGTLGDIEFDWLTARARGGFSMVMTCAAFVDVVGRAWPGQLGIADDTQLPGLTRLAAGIREHGASAMVQIHHAGARASVELHPGKNRAPFDDESMQTEALSTAEVQELIEKFVQAAVRAETAGFDGVQVHGAHDYVISQFLSKRSIDRDDQYGGSLENRSRMLFEMLEGIRANTGPDFHVGLRLTPENKFIDIAESKTVASEVLASGLIDHLEMSLWDVFMSPSRTGSLPRLIDEFTELDRGETRLGVSGKINSAADVQWCLDQGADFVAVGTAAIIGHDFAANCLRDESFVAKSEPFNVADLREQGVSDVFLEYLSGRFPNMIAN